MADMRDMMPERPDSNILPNKKLRTINV